jgi:hypothetical protein
MGKNYGKVAAYTILKNERQHIDTWVHYANSCDGIFCLDTGSTDGSYEYLLELAKDNPKIHVEQKIYTKWHFSNARNDNLAMIPMDYDWAQERDMDEWYSVNWPEVLERTLIEYPNVDCIACARLDIYSPVVNVGKATNQLGTNKLHKLNDPNGNRLYTWKSPIYEHLSFIPKDRSEVEIYVDDLYLIHNQSYSKKRSELYRTMLLQAWEEDPTYEWTNWFACNEMWKERNLEMFIKIGCDFVRYHKSFDSKYHEVLGALTHMYHSPEISVEQKMNIESVIKGKSI